MVTMAEITVRIMKLVTILHVIKQTVNTITTTRDVEMIRFYDAS